MTLATRDVEGTCAFYEATLRWRRIKIPGNTPIEAAWIRIGPNQAIHILGVDGFEPSPFEAEFGRHLAVFHPGPDFPALKERLVARGAELMDPIRPTPFERFFFRDPNGYVIEVIDEAHWVDES